MTAALAASVVLLDPGAASACGGCFVQQTERTVVTDHRMALSVSPTQTVLWDQIRYSGNPAEFAWVLPVRSGAKIELANDAFFTALDASTQPVIYAPATYGGAYGCGLTGCGSQTTSADSESAPGAGQVQILSQAVVGPYETVTLRATDPTALRRWLKSHAYDIPTTIEPTIDAYVAESFDFIALRLRPDCGERAMQPVRIVTQGADPTLPLRMVAAGVGARVGLTLYVISEGRFQPQNFPHELIDESQVTWSRTQNKSNYEPLVESLMAGHDGRTWVTEYADQPQLFATYDPRYYGRSPAYVVTGSGAVPALADTYYSQCRSRYGAGSAASGSRGASGGSAAGGQSGFVTPCPNAADASVVSQGDGGVEGDAGESADAGAEASADAGAEADADADADADAGEGADAGAGSGEDAGADAGDGGTISMQPAPAPVGPGTDCAYLDDIDVAMRGLHPTDVWVTRLRANLPANALAAGDLRLEAASTQTAVSNVHYASSYEDESSAGAGSRDACVSAPKRHTAFGSWAIAAVTAIGAMAFLRRRAQPRR